VRKGCSKLADLRTRRPVMIGHTDMMPVAAAMMMRLRVVLVGRGLVGVTRRM
jgi:hypothetical protein